MDLTTQFYSQPSRMSAYHVYQTRQQKGGGFFNVYNGQSEWQRKNKKGLGSFMNLIAGVAGGIKTYRDMKKL